MRLYINQDVFDAALARIEHHYAAGDNIIVATSGGKDSTCVLELCVIAATNTGKLPVQVATRDEEINFPGTYEYLEALHERPELDVHWIVAQQPIINCFNREQPFWWVFDDRLPPEQWVRRPPSWHTPVEELSIDEMITRERFPTPDDKLCISVLGIRANESLHRLQSIFSSKGALSRTDSPVRILRPIYDWKDADVWKAIKDFGWTYNTAYDTFHRVGLRNARTGPPTMNPVGLRGLQIGAQAWPKWFDRVATRCPGVRTAVQFGSRTYRPYRRTGEKWQATFQRECVNEAPPWIAERSVLAAERVLRSHGRHSTSPLPEIDVCRGCPGELGSWSALANYAYLGDPFCTKLHMLPYVEPEKFRPGAGTWFKKKAKEPTLESVASSSVP